MIHIDATGLADPMPVGMRGPPFVVVRVQPMAGELSRYKVTSSDPDDAGEEDIVQTMRVPDRIVQTSQLSRRCWSHEVLKCDSSSVWLI